MNNIIKKNQLVGIQYLRGLAVILVVLDHITAMSAMPKYFGNSLNIVNNWFLAGAVGVELFFVISGFIILYVSLSSNTLTPKLDTATFFRHRIIRILPFLWICIIGFALLKLLGRGGAFPAMEYLRSMTLFPIGEVEPRPVWTLRHEFLFYSLFAIFIIKLKGKWFWLSLWFLSPFVWFGLGFSKMMPPSNWRELISFLFDIHNILFGIGYLIGLLYKKGLLSFSVRINHGFLFCILLVVPVFFAARFTGMTHASSTFLQVLTCGLFSALAVVIAISINSENPLNYLDRVGVIIGNASYSIYLTHSGVISMMLGIWAKVQYNANPLMLLITVCLASLVAGVIIHFVVEKPLINFIKNKMKIKESIQTFVDSKNSVTL